MNKNQLSINKFLLVFLILVASKSSYANNFWYELLKQYKVEELIITPHNISSVEGYEFIVDALQIASPPNLMNENQLAELSSKNMGKNLLQLQTSSKVAVIYIPNVVPSSVLPNQERITEKGISNETYITRIQRELEKLENSEGNPWKINIYRKLTNNSNGNFQIQIKCSIRPLTEQELNELENKVNRNLEYKFGGYNTVYRHKYFIRLKYMKIEDAISEIERLVRLGVKDVFINKL